MLQLQIVTQEENILPTKAVTMDAVHVEPIKTRTGHNIRR